MKNKIAAALLAGILICGAASCGNSAQTSAASTTEAPVVKDFTAADVTAAVLEQIPINSAFDKQKDSVPDYFEGLDPDFIEDFSYVICASGAYPDEIAVMKFMSEANAQDAVSAVQSRLEEQKSTYKDYTPDEYYKIENAVVKQSGVWIYYLVTSDNENAEKIVNNYIR